MEIITGNANQALVSQIDQFLTAKRRSRRARSPQTHEQYRFVLERVLLPWCSAEGIAEAGELTTLNMERFIDYLEAKRTKRDKPLSVSTIRTYLRSVKIFLKWAGVPKGSYEEPPEPKRLRSVPTREEIAAMERAARNERDRLIIRTLADSGVRVSELLGLRPEDLRGDTHSRCYYIRVSGKTGEREVGIPHETFYRLRKLGGDAPYLFRGRSGRLTKSGAEQVVRRLAKKAKITRRIFPHLFRHGYATLMARKHVEMLLVAKSMGHTTLAMVAQIYSHVTAEDAYGELMRALK